jgi:CRISPR-associated protein Cas1
VDVNPRRTSEREFEILHSRSVSLAGPEVGITCKIDLLEGQGINVTPVDYKRGVAPDIPEGAYEPERVQLCAQGLVLKENGFQCNGGAVYFIQSKKRVTIPFTEALVDRTKELIANLKIIAKKEEMPLPLEDSPKCIRCSLAGICLPDEVNLMREMEAEGIYEKSPRKLIPTRDDQIPVYVVGQGPDHQEEMRLHRDLV